MPIKFKTYNGKPIEDVGSYIRKFINENHNNVDILIGCDSQGKGRKTKYCTSIVLYVRGNGGHVIFTEEITPIEKNIQVKIINETWKAISVAEYLKEINLDCVKYIDIDVNPDPKYGSNSAFKQAVGMVEGMGYKFRYKHGGAMINHTADHLARN